MKKHFLSLRFFVTGLFISTIIVSPFVLDFTLTARFVSLSFFSLLSIWLLFKNQTLKINFDIITLSYILFVLFSTLSISWANTKSEAIFDSAKLIVGFTVFGLTVYYLNTDRNRFLSLLSKIPALIFFVAIVAGTIQLLTVPDLKKDSMYLITGINGHKNLYSSFIFLNLFFLFAALPKVNKPWKIINVVCIALAFCMIIILRTKAVWIAIAVSLMVFSAAYFFRNKKLPKVNIVLVVGAFVLLANIFFISVLQPLISKGIKSNATIIALKPEMRQQSELDNERLVLWDKTYGVFQKHRVSGIGAGNWQINFPDETLKSLWRAEDLNYTFQRPHNDWLWILSETGLIGFNLFLLFLFSLLVLCGNAIQNTSVRFVQIELAGCLAAITGFYTISFFDFPKERIEHTIWINIIFAITYFHIKQCGLLKTYGSLPANTLNKMVVVLLLTFIFTIGLLRYKGEYYTRKMYDQKKINNFSGVITNGEKAESFAYSIDPTSLPVCWFKGNAYAALANYPKAHREFEKAYQLNPYNRNVLNDLASSFVFLNEQESAKKLYEEAARISPRFDDPKLNLAAQYIRQQNYQKADEVLKSILHDSERRSNYQKMVDAFLNQNH